MRHVSRRRHRHPSKYYTTPVRVRGGSINDQGQRIPEQRTELPEALFAPGTSTEEGLLSDVAEHKAQLFFHERVDVRSSDSIELTVVGEVSRWSVDGHAKHWPRGTEVVLVRAS